MCGDIFACQLAPAGILSASTTLHICHNSNDLSPLDPQWSDIFAQNNLSGRRWPDVSNLSKLRQKSSTNLTSREDKRHNIFLKISPLPLYETRIYKRENYEFIKILDKNLRASDSIKDSSISVLPSVSSQSFLHSVGD